MRPQTPKAWRCTPRGIYRVLVLVTRPALWLTSTLAYGFLRLFGVVRAANTTQP